jgi:predicted MFS family arabinose efflux permease
VVEEHPVPIPTRRDPILAAARVGTASAGSAALIAAAFVSMVDRSVTPPLVTVVAKDMGASLALIASAVTIYSLAYAGLQLVWSALATRYSRIRLLAISTGIAGLADAASAFAPDPTSFLLARGLAGGAFAATFTAVLIHFGDTLTMRQRAVATANLAGAVSLGLAAGTVGAGIIAQLSSWRWVYAAVAAASIVLAIVLACLPAAPPPPGEHVLPSIRRLSHNRWALAVLAFTVLEGTLLVGVFASLPVALQAKGTSVLVAGLVTAAFGITVVLVSQLMKLVLGRWSAWLLLLLAGCTAFVGYLVLTLDVSPFSVLAAAALLGVAWTLGHTTIQTWMTDAVHDGRAIGMSFFSIALFAGGSLGAALGGVAASGGGFRALFGGAAIGAAAFAISTAFARSRYRVRE